MVVYTIDEYNFFHPGRIQEKSIGVSFKGGGCAKTFGPSTPPIMVPSVDTSLVRLNGRNR